MLTIDKRNKYKDDKKIKKEFEKKKKQLEKIKQTQERNFLKKIEAFKEKESFKINRKINKIEKKKQREFDIFVRAEKELKPLKVKENAKYRAKKAKVEICKYSKLLRADLNWYVRLMDTGQYVYRNKAHGGHLYWVKNNPHMQYDIDNIRPISAMGNKAQLDQVGNRKSAVYEEIWPEHFLYLVQKSENKGLKEIAKGRKEEIHKAIYEKYKKLNEKLLKDNPKLDPKNLLEL